MENIDPFASLMCFSYSNIKYDLAGSRMKRITKSFLLLPQLQSDALATNKLLDRTRYENEKNANVQVIHIISPPKTHTPPREHNKPLGDRET